MAVAVQDPQTNAQSHYIKVMTTGCLFECPDAHAAPITSFAMTKYKETLVLFSGSLDCKVKAWLIDFTNK